MPFETGPYIQAASFCDQVIEDKTGVLSLIRVIDTLTHTEARPDAPEEMPPVIHHMKLVIMLKPGSAKGRQELRIVPESPSGETKEPIMMSVQMAGEERGANIIADVVFTFTMEGLYWFNVYLNDVLFTKIPFRMQYKRLITGVTPPK